MSREKKILFTSVGRRVELMQAFRAAAVRLKVALTIVGADMSPEAPALAFCDEKIQVCRISDSNYIPGLLQVCKKRKIDALIPTIDTDLLLLAEHKEEFEAIGTKVIISPVESVKLCRDKRYTSQFFADCGLHAPMPVDNVENYSLGFPCFIKPKDGSSSINAYRADDMETLRAYAAQVPDYIIQPFIDGEEYTIDIFCDLLGNAIHITPRKRLAVRSGEVLKTEITLDEEMIAECKAIVDKFHPIGAITVQLIKEHKTGINYYIEINPRFGGGAPLSIKAGADEAEDLLRILDGQTLAYGETIAEDGRIYSRFDQSICVNKPEKKVKVVLFDLDDTLYDEVDYVKSGFRKVADFLTEKKNGVDFYSELLQAWKPGISAFDVIFEKFGLNKEILLDECLRIYRWQEPDIQLSEEVRCMLECLRKKDIKLGIITDGRPEGQRAKIKALGLEEYMDEIIVTDELGGPLFRKPNDIAFRIMKYRFDVDYEEMLYIGDNAAKDFVAPKCLGMRSLRFYNSKGIYADGDVRDSKWTEMEKDILTLCR